MFSICSCSVLPVTTIIFIICDIVYVMINMLNVWYLHHKYIYVAFTINMNDVRHISRIIIGIMFAVF